MPARKVMNQRETLQFQRFLRAGLEQYETTPAKAGKRQRQTVTSEDLLAERLGIQKTWKPLTETGYATAAKVGRLIENSCSRATTVERARLSLFALVTSSAAAAWRKAHGWDADKWFRKLQQYRADRVSWAEHLMFPAGPQDPLMEARAAIHPRAIPLIAEAVAKDLYDNKILTKRQVDEAATAVARGLQKRASSWSKAFVRWVELAESLREVRIEETEEMQKEGVPLRVTRMRVLRHGSGDQTGRTATHAEFLEGVLTDLSATGVAEITAT